MRECKRRGWLCMKFVSPGRVGVPDRIIMMHGVVIFVEVKSPTGKLSARQQNELALYDDYGMNTAVVRSYADVKELLDRWT